MKPIMIIENNLNPLNLFEEFVTASNKKVIIIGGVFTEFDVKNRNERVYTANKFLPCLDELNERIINMGVYGEFDHPDVFDTSLSRASHLVKEAIFNKDLNRVLAANISPGNGLTFDAAGYPLTYSQDNMSGILIRIGSLANPNGLPAHWTANNTDLTIVHNLGKIPYGVIAIFKQAAADVWFGTVAPTDTDITLQTNNDATDMTVWILA